MIGFKTMADKVRNAEVTLRARWAAGQMWGGGGRGRGGGGYGDRGYGGGGRGGGGGGTGQWGDSAQTQSFEA
eukprot:SAG22_NODE_1074_length_5688_cov_92.719449_4_plen_72_part_00